MAQLDISTFSGHQQTVTLDKRQALSIGAHPSNDIQVEGDDVEIMHCRISWNKQGFEVVAAGSDGVDINGTLVQKALLSPGDVMRVGEADITYKDENGEASSAASKSKKKQADDGLSAFSLKPLSGEMDIAKAAAPPKKVQRQPVDDDEPLSAEEILTEDVEPPRKRSARDKQQRAEEEQQRKKEERRKRKQEELERRKQEERQQRKQKERDKAKSKTKEKETAAGGAAAEVDELGEDSFDLEELASVAGVEAAPDEVDETKAIHRSTDAAIDESFADDDEPVDAAPQEKVSLREKFRPRPQRPGERDAVRSPLVLMLSGGAAVLVLTGLTFYFIINRQTTQTAFDAAKSVMDEGNYRQAIRDFESFIVLHPRDPLVEDATVHLGVSRIEQHITGASPRWTEGLAELNAFINARRDLPDFPEHQEGIRRRAERIAEGAAASAGKSYDRALLAISDEARNLLTRFSPEDARPEDALKRIQSVWRSSEAAILKHETLTAAIAAIDKALEEKRPMDALVERRELLRRYPDFENDKRIVDKLAQILETEQDLVVRSDEPIDAVTDDHTSDVPAPLTLTFHARARTDEVSEGRTVYGLAKDCCYAVDSITGEPVWRRVIGWDSPFFPVTVNASVPALLVFSTQHDELQLLDQKTGELLWRQPAVTEVTGPPTVEQGQIYVLSRSGTLSKVDVDSGQVTSQLAFSQPVVAPATPLLDGERLLVAGSQEVLYTLSNRPLECIAVTYFGHKPGSIAAPLLSMGALVLMGENQPRETSLLHVFDTRRGNQLAQIDRASIPGHVVDPPVIRGRDVFVPSTGERISSFSASDEPGQTPLVVGPRYEPEGAEQSPMFLQTGPDRKVWMASRYLRQLQLTTDSIQPGSRVVNIGIATQPIQLQGRKLYIGRALPYSTATTLLQTDQEELTSDWQCVVGAAIAGWGSYPDQDGLVAVSESGDVFRITDADLTRGGFLTSATVRLSLPEGLRSPLGARQLADGQIAVWCGEPQPQLWLVNRVGQTNRPLPLPGELECAPTLLGDRIVAPVGGKLHLLRTRSGQPQVQEYSLPQGENGTPRWRQLIDIDESTLLAVTDAGQLIQVRLQTSPQAFLAESGRFELEDPLAFDVAAGEGVIAVASGQKLQVLDAATLEPRGEAALPAPVSNAAWVVGDIVFVETARQNLHLFSLSDGLAEIQTLPLEGVPLAGAPLSVGGTLVIALRDGTVVNINAGDGQIQGQTQIGQPVGTGPRLIGQTVLTTTVDGSFVRIGSAAGSP
jgi:outer membrane protein assembly factor BamB/TolA-binding protein